jgi:hypothetical protein
MASDTVPCSNCSGAGFLSNKYAVGGLSACTICNGNGYVKVEERAMPANSPEALTNERKNQHGDWRKQAMCAGRLKQVAEDSTNYPMLAHYQREALDMILTKVSRILEGDPAHADHWDDIAGYAFLGRGGHSKDTADARSA